jgi:hypothetical protein
MRHRIVGYHAKGTVAGRDIDRLREGPLSMRFETRQSVSGCKIDVITDVMEDRHSQ